MRLIFGYLDLAGGSAVDAADILNRIRQNLAPDPARAACSHCIEGPIALMALEFGAARPADPLPDDGHSSVAADARLDVPLSGEGDDSEQFARYLMARRDEAQLTPVLGDFASARWDREARTLTLACDGFAIRPLAYAYRPGAYVAFASLPRALRAAGLADAPVDEAVLLGRCVNRTFPNEAVGGIRRVPAGHWVRFSADGMDSAPFWRLDPAIAGTLDMPVEEAADRLRALIDQAVRCRLPRTGRVGTHLSGGLDSSAITVMAARALRERTEALHAFTHLERDRNDFPPPPDRDLVQQVLAQEDNVQWAPIHFAPPRGEQTAVCSDTIFPSADDEINHQTAAAAAARGVSLILSGFGGNEGASYRNHDAIAEHLTRGQWRRLARQIRLSLRHGERWQSILLNRVMRHLVSARTDTRLRRLFGRPPRVMATEAMADLLTAEGRALLKNNPARFWSRTADSRVNRHRLLTNTHIYDVTLHLADSGARHGVAYAFPLLDRRVVEFALALPVDLLQQGHVARFTFRSAMAGVLPDTVRYNSAPDRARPGYAVDLLSERDRLLERLASYRQNERVRRLFDVDAIEAHLRAAPSVDELTPMLQREDPAASDIGPRIALIGFMLDRLGHIAALD